MTVTVLINKGGGTASADPGIDKKVRAALLAAGVAHELHLIEGSDCTARCKALAKRGDKLIVVGGGDGTISAAASALAGSKTMLGILPLGTLNHFARDLGIPFDLNEAAAVIAAGTSTRVDIAEMNGRIFINNSAIGLYPMMVLDREKQQERLGRSKRLALLVASLRALARFNHERLSLTVNGKKKQLDTPLLFVGNNDYRIDIAGAGQRSSISDGELCVLVMRKKSRLGLIAAAIRALARRARKDDMVRIRDVERLRVDSHKSRISVSLDGEIVSAKPPLDYQIRKQALRVIAP
jgi:YegS/Rv2252/BmrU family lipid kinase